MFCVGGKLQQRSQFRKNKNLFFFKIHVKKQIINTLFSRPFTQKRTCDHTACRGNLLKTDPRAGRFM